ncbi:MAG: hypothetical protein AAGF96_06030 [Bacteroidota bacterium]
MSRKKLVENQTKEELAFEMACKMAGRNITSQDSRFFIKILDLIREDPNLKIGDVAELAKECYDF